jgi:hypothetical protein
MIVTAIVILTFVIGIGLVLYFKSPALGIVAYLGVPAICTVIWAMWPKRYKAPKSGAHRRVLWERRRSVGLAAVEPGEEGDRIEGQVRGEETLRSPIGGVPCVAFRLRGRAGPMEVDDAWMAPFEVTLDDGGRAVVELGEGGLDVEAPRPEEVEVTDELAELLKRKGVEPEGEVELAEAVLRAGDRVVVTGAGVERDEARGDGYRGSETVWVFTDRGEPPLVVRAVRR